MADDSGGRALLAFILGGVLVVLAVIGLMMISGRAPAGVAVSKPSNIMIRPDLPASPAPTPAEPAT